MQLLYYWQCNYYILAAVVHLPLLLSVNCYTLLITAGDCVCNIMEYSLEAIHQTDADLESVMKSIGNLDQSMLMKKNKDVLVNFVRSLADVANKNQSILRSAAAEIDELKSDNLKSQRSLISLQQEVIQNKSEQLDSVKNTVKTEIKTWANVVTKSCSGNQNMGAPKKLIREAVKSVIGEHDRSCNIVVFGAVEVKEQDKDDVPVTDELYVKKIFENIGVQPYYETYYRAGKEKAGTSRPLIVKMGSPVVVSEVLANAKLLKESRFYGKCFLAPDRSPEERIEHRKLIDEMKKRRGEEPEKYFYIRKGEVCCSERTEKDTAS